MKNREVALLFGFLLGLAVSIFIASVYTIYFRNSDCEAWGMNAAYGVLHALSAGG